MNNERNGRDSTIIMDYLIRRNEQRLIITCFTITRIMNPLVVQIGELFEKRVY